MNTQINPISVTAFRWVPPPVRGLVRDLRVRWALEEAGLPYTAKLIGPKDQASTEYREWQPFGQVPAFEQDGLKLDHHRLGCLNIDGLYRLPHRVRNHLDINRSHGIRR